MTTRQHPRLNTFALTLVTLAVFSCSSSAQKQETPTPTVAPTVSGVTEPEAIDPNAPAIAYTGDGGFVPKRLDIEPGTQVRFVNASDGDFWPASNIHPTHMILPELDAKKPDSIRQDVGFHLQDQGLLALPQSPRPGNRRAGGRPRKRRRAAT